MARQPGRIEGAGRRRGERGSGQSDCGRGEPARSAQRLLLCRRCGCGADSHWAAGCEVSRKVIQGPKQERDPNGEDSVRPLRRSDRRISDQISARRFAQARPLPRRPDPADAERDRFPAGALLGSVSGELGLRKFLEAAGHQLVVTEDKDGPNSEFERELVGCGRRDLAAFLAGLSDRRADRQGEEPQARDHRRNRFRPCRPACGDRSRDHGRRGHLLQLDQRRRARRDDDPVAGPQLSAVVGPGEGRRLEHRRLRIAILRCRGDACRDRRRRADRKRGAAPPQAVRHAPALYRSPPASARGRAGAGRDVPRIRGGHGPASATSSRSTRRFTPRPRICSTRR